MKKFIALLLTLCMVLPGAAYADAPLTDGVYTAAEAGMMGPVPVEVTIENGTIVELMVDASNETQGIGTEATMPIIDAVMEQGTWDVDGVAGATITSNAIKAGIKLCLEQAAGAEAPVFSGFTAGTYTATQQGARGPVTVEVVFSADRIESVTVTDHKETRGIGYAINAAPVESLPAAIVAAQSVAVDSVTGATLTSAAIKNAVADCVRQAGSDPSVLAAVAPVTYADETYDVDIVVVGAGAAGLAAARTAQEAGANVILLEKLGVTGGSTARSGGKILGAGTPWQEKQGFEDTPELMTEYLMSFDKDGIMDRELVSFFAENSAANIEWLVERGTEIQDVEPIHSSLTPWRVHNVMGGGGMTDGHGGWFTAPLTSLYEKEGGVILYNTQATELLTDGNGTVTGVLAVHPDGTTVTVNAKNVILTTGGYAHNEEMIVDQYGDFMYTNLYSGVPMTNVGDGLIMAEAIGAKNTKAPGLQLVYCSYDCYAGINEESGLIVTDTGDRVVNEWTYQSHVANALADAKSHFGFYIAAKKDGYAVEPYPMIQWGVTMEQVPHAATIEELATLIGMEPEKLAATVARYNELCAAGEDADFGKPAEFMIPVEGDEYYAFRMTPGSSVTFGGLSIDKDAHVLDVNDKPIPGLYAAGEVAFTGLFDAEYPCCGMAIGSAVWFGRTAAGNAVAGK
ncbi:MAG: FAD-dependent oxidoreductase [Clostridia bacterium]|nr:FAD-dependent oxidoreductase [Clostridia bacterium]